MPRHYSPKELKSIKERQETFKNSNKNRKPLSPSYQEILQRAKHHHKYLRDYQETQERIKNIDMWSGLTKNKEDK